MNDIKKLIEQKKLEALDKQLIGDKGKLASIAKYLGKPIYEHITEIEDLDSNEIPLLSEEDESIVIGWFYYGLRFGLDLKIDFIDEDIVVWFKGSKVYEELGGQLVSYLSNPEWEDAVNNLMVHVEKIKIKEDEVGKIKKEKENEAKLNSIVDFLKKMWGIEI